MLYFPLTFVRNLSKLQTSYIHLTPVGQATKLFFLPVTQHPLDEVFRSTMSSTDIDSPWRLHQHSPSKAK